ncbi:DUF2974 domain-containing protein [Weissella diestrammenae]|uniref:DUF2974 domain-containing protein n=1 Tax=Weissella diestrammenae TaxID=1162633 RepID=A0A7G9T5S9_9LACO|nr:Mbeg1-like protein [Weissella diestrammenae]MCM0582283.1 DUF2974 domain-containing protein [Weissella diestrammenae]QNN75454.1 DUF2974 domain-containing protein [Weissella diestrammenae]
MRKLTNENLVLLDTLIYTISDNDFNDVTGKTVAELVRLAQAQLSQHQLPIMMSEASWQQILQIIQNNYWLQAHRVVSVYHDELATALVFESPTQTNYSVIFRGTVSAVEWLDNFRSMFVATEIYGAVRTFIDQLPAKYGKLVVSGHSRGGKFAIYVAMLCQRVERAVSVNGPGFSVDFAMKHRHIATSEHKELVYIDKVGDVIHSIGVRLPGTTISIAAEPEVTSPYKNHMTDVMLDSYGYFKDYNKNKTNITTDVVVFKS